jgi:hypothetical protein
LIIFNTFGELLQGGHEWGDPPPSETDKSNSPKSANDLYCRVVLNRAMQRIAPTRFDKFVILRYHVLLRDRALQQTEEKNLSFVSQA